MDTFKGSRELWNALFARDVNVVDMVRADSHVLEETTSLLRLRIRRHDAAGQLCT
jgi:hypothetical protein